MNDIKINYKYKLIILKYVYRTQNMNNNRIILEQTLNNGGKSLLAMSSVISSFTPLINKRDASRVSSDPRVPLSAIQEQREFGGGNRIPLARQEFM